MIPIVIPFYVGSGEMLEYELRPQVLLEFAITPPTFPHYTLEISIKQLFIQRS